MVEVAYKSWDPDEFIAELNLVPSSVHPRMRCIGEYCAIHRPSPHPMRSWPARFDSSTGLVERECQHGFWHPDPDSTAWFESRGGSSLDHPYQCDGCCP